MHDAPKVHWSVQRLRIGVGLSVVLWTAGLSAHGVWWLLSPAVPAAHAGALLVLFASGALALGAWARLPIGVLQSDDQGWTWTQERVPAVQGSLEVCIDMQRVLLLRFVSGQRRVVWLWVANSDDATEWRAFRRALFAPRGKSKSSAPEQSRTAQGCIAR